MGNFLTFGQCVAVKF